MLDNNPQNAWRFSLKSGEFRLVWAEPGTGAVRTSTNAYAAWRKRRKAKNVENT